MLLYRMFNKLLIKNFLLKFYVFSYFLKYYIALVPVACLDCRDCSERHHYRIKPFNCASKSLITNKSAEEEGRVRVVGGGDDVVEETKIISVFRNFALNAVGGGSQLKTAIPSN